MQTICQISINNDFEQKIRASDIINDTNEDSMIDKKHTIMKNNRIDFIKTMFPAPGGNT
jgi:hypothetical protein